jgi:hypothetical protein
MAETSHNSTPVPRARSAGVCAANDLISTWWACTVWCASGAAFLCGFSMARWRPELWIASLSVAGALCLINAVRCRRMHCLITAPVFLIGALLTALNTASVIAIPWKELGWGVVVGLGVGMLAEMLVGRYARA